MLTTATGRGPRRRFLQLALAASTVACGGGGTSPPPPPPLTTSVAVAAVTGAVDVPLRATPVTASGGTPPYSYSLNTSLPAGLALDAGAGEIIGTPAGTFATATFTITVTDAARATSSQSFSLAIDGPQGVDLTIDTLLAPASAFVDSTLTVIARVRNRGGRKSEPFRVGFYVSRDTAVTVVDQFIGACTVPAGLASGGSVDCGESFTIPETIAPGTYFVGAVADDIAQTGESNRANNTRTSRVPTSVSPPRLPDLVITAVTAPPTTTLNSVFSVAATIANRGTAPSGPFHLGFYYSTDSSISTADARAGGCSHTRLATGAEVECRTSIRIPSSLPAGRYYIGAIVDDSARVRESDESNNTRAPAASTQIAEPTVNLSIDGMYLTQAAQTYDGAVPLAAGRAALLRVFVKASEPNTLAPDVRVRFYRNGSLVETRTIAAPTPSVPTTVDEGVLGASWNVMVPASMITAGLAIVADVDPDTLIGETFRGDNVFPRTGVPRTLDVRPAPPFEATLVPIVQTPNGLQGDVTEANREVYLEFAKRVYPLASASATVHAPFSYGFAISRTYDDTWDLLLAELDAARVAEGSTRNYHGVIRPAYSSGATGRGTLAGHVSVGIDRTTLVPGSNTEYRSMTAAHEWGHNFGRRHVDCGGPESVDPVYPYENGRIGAFGYDLTRNQVLDPATFRDLMSYCTPLWISDYTVRAVLEFRAANPPVATTVAQRSLLVWGRIGPSGIVLEPAFEIVAPPALPPRPGRYRLRATDDAGRTLFDLSFDGTAIAESEERRQFAFVVPLGNASPATLRLGDGQREVARVARVDRAAGDGIDVSARRVNGRVSLAWNAADYPMALVRDPETREVLGFARNGRIDVASAQRTLDVIFSDGVRSVRRLIPVAPR